MKHNHQTLLTKNNAIPNKLNPKTYQGFEEIYRLYFKMVYGICYSTTQNKDLSQNMTQDIFLSLWKRRENLQIKVPIKYYLARAAKLTLMEYYRTQKTHNKHKKIIEQRYTEEDNSTEDSILFNELQQEVNSLVEKLPKRGRSIFKLSREKGMTNKEIAKTLDISEKGVEYHMTKTISQLRKGLEGKIDISSI